MDSRNEKSDWQSEVAPPAGICGIKGYVGWIYAACLQSSIMESHSVIAPVS